MFAAATSWLEREVESLNAINVFPVPDGDTGTNMYLTMRSTLEEARARAPARVGDALKAMARGALMGARGNSGVILSQIIRGWAQAVEGLERMDGEAMARALAEGASAAYQGISRPVEGTILTVAREAAEAAQRQAARRGQGLVAVLGSAAEAARQAVAETPALLPVLAEAGVVDAGGQGLYIILEGVVRYLQGIPVGARGPAPLPKEPSPPLVGVGEQWLAATQAMHQQGELPFVPNPPGPGLPRSGMALPYGCCTEYLLEGTDLDLEAIRRRMEELGDSVLVVGDDRLARVHVHTRDPGAAIGYGTTLGSLTSVKVDNMDAQHRVWATHHAQPTRASGPSLRQRAVAEAPNIAAVAVAFGPGLANVFRSLGATAVVQVGPNVKPSTQEILAAIQDCPSEQVVVLPNDENVVMAAQQAAELAQSTAAKSVQVLAALTAPQGLAALLALNQQQGLVENLRAMERAMASVRTAAVAPSVRSSTIGGVPVRQGQIVALADGRLLATADTTRETTLVALRELRAEEASLVTLYWGAGIVDEEARAMAEAVRSAYPGLEVEAVYGGQPHYCYIVSVE